MRKPFKIRVKSAQLSRIVHILFTIFHANLHKTEKTFSKLRRLFRYTGRKKQGILCIYLKRKEAENHMMENKFIGLDVDDLIFGKDERETSQR